MEQVHILDNQSDISFDETTFMPVNQGESSPRIFSETMMPSVPSPTPGMTPSDDSYSFLSTEDEYGLANKFLRTRSLPDLTDDSYNSPTDRILFRRSVSWACLANTHFSLLSYFIGTPSHSQSRRSSQYGDGSPSSQRSITFAASPPNMEGPITFEAPELIGETITKPERNETVERLHIMHGIVKTIVELAQSRNGPLAESLCLKDVTGTNTASHLCFVSEKQRRAEQMVLYARAMELLTAALRLAKEELASNKLMNSKAVRHVISELHNQYKGCFQQCKTLQLRKVEFSKDVDKLSVEITADKLMYSHVVKLCQSTALDEKVVSHEECIGRYHSAQMLLHGLLLQAREEKDRDQLLKFKNILNQRLLFLEKQIHAT